MKCPKCGYHSFEHLNACKKCQTDLSAFKTTHKIVSVITPRTTAATPQLSSQAPRPAAEEPPDHDDFLIGNPAIFTSADHHEAANSASDDSVFSEFSFNEDAPAASELKENAWDSPAAAVPLTLGNSPDAQEFPDLFGDAPLQEGETPQGEAAKQLIFSR